MGWKDDYLPASFRGVSFFVKSSTVDSGRRQVTHAYPRSDVVEHEDLGADDTKFSFNGYIVGDDYFSPRDKLEKAFRENSTGLLIHPFRNAVNVSVDTYSITEEADRGGVAFFRVTFLLDPEPAIRVIPSLKAQVELVSAEMDEVVSDWFEDVYDVDNVSFGILDDILDTLESVLGVLNTVKKVASIAAAFKRQISNIRGKLIAIRVKAGAIAFTIKGLVDFGVDTADALGNLFTAKDQQKEQQQIYASTKKPYTSNTTSDISENPSYPTKQIRNLIAYNTVSSLAKLTTKMTFESSEDISSTQKVLLDIIDELSSAAGIDDSVFEILRRVRSSVYRYLQEEINQAPKIFSIQPNRSRNTLELCHDFYGSLEREQDIIDRNKLIHPGFIDRNEALFLKTD